MMLKTQFFPEFLDVVGRLLRVFPAGELPRLGEQEFDVPVHCLPPYAWLTPIATIDIPGAVDQLSILREDAVNAPRDPLPKILHGRDL